MRLVNGHTYPELFFIYRTYHHNYITYMIHKTKIKYNKEPHWAFMLAIGTILIGVLYAAFILVKSS